MNTQYDELAVFHTLRSEVVRSLIQEQGLKKWWVAEVAGIHKTTLRRWLSGEITKVKKENLERLAQVLTREPSAISLPVSIIRREKNRLTPNTTLGGNILD